MLHEYKMRMPNQHLTDTEVAAVVTYLTSSIAAPAPAAASPIAPGDAAAGKALFTGTVGLRNGGAPCMACHSVAAIGALGGGTMGPDLSRAYTKLGAALIAWPTTMPVMRPIYAGAPLTDQEQADLLAFLKGEALAQRTFSARGLACRMGEWWGVPLAARGTAYMAAAFAGRTQSVAQARVANNGLDTRFARTEVATMGRVLPQPLAARQCRAQHPRGELHRRMLLGGLRQGWNHHLGDAGEPTIRCWSRHLPPYEPRGCQRGISSSWYVYSPLRVKYPYMRGALARPVA